MTEPPVATRINARYDSLVPLGRGGAATVHVARDTETGNLVALKRLLPHGSRESHLAMLHREARVGALLRHENAARVLEFGEDGGEFFLALEYVEGENLDRVLEECRRQKKRLGPNVIAYLIASAAAGLDAAHELTDESGTPLHLVHRDLTPHNVLIGYDGAVKVADFGVAKIDVDSTRTRTGEVKGKMAYMAPEQALGDPLDRRADLWALGTILHECVTLQRMWGDGTDVEIMRKLALEAPPPLPADSPFVALHDRLVSRDPSARPATAREVQDEIAASTSTASLEQGRRELVALITTLFERDRAAMSARIEEAVASPHSVVAAQPPPPRASRPTWLWAAAALGLAAIAFTALRAVATRGAETPRPSSTSVLASGTSPTLEATGATSTPSASASAPEAPPPPVASAVAATPSAVASSVTPPIPSLRRATPRGSATAAAAVPTPTATPSALPTAAAVIATTKPHPVGPPVDPNPF